jgi:hypothetical protein
MQIDFKKSGVLQCLLPVFKKPDAEKEAAKGPTRRSI